MRRGLSQGVWPAGQGDAVYYESFGAALGGAPFSENAGTGGISSDSKDGEESESWGLGRNKGPDEAAGVGRLVRGWLLAGEP